MASACQTLDNINPGLLKLKLVTCESAACVCSLCLLQHVVAFDALDTAAVSLATTGSSCSVVALRKLHVMCCYAGTCFLSPSPPAL